MRNRYPFSLPQCDGTLTLQVLFSHEKHLLFSSMLRPQSQTDNSISFSFSSSEYSSSGYSSLVSAITWKTIGVVIEGAIRLKASMTPSIVDGCGADVLPVRPKSMISRYLKTLL